MFKMAREIFSADERATLDGDYETWKRSDVAAQLVVAEKAKAGRWGDGRPRTT